MRKNPNGMTGCCLKENEASYQQLWDPFHPSRNVLTCFFSIEFFINNSMLNLIFYIFEENRINEIFTYFFFAQSMFQCVDPIFFWMWNRNWRKSKSRVNIKGCVHKLWGLRIWRKKAGLPYEIHEIGCKLWAGVMEGKILMKK